MSEDITERTALLGPQRNRVKISSDANSPRSPRFPGLSTNNSYLGMGLRIPSLYILPVKLVSS